MDNNRYIDFEAYESVAEPHKREKASVWRTAIGLQDVDGLKVSDYLKQTAIKHIEGDITIEEVREQMRPYYNSQTPHDKDNDIPDIVNRFHNLKGEESRSRKEQSFLVPVEEIRNNDYDLSINKYKEIEREKVVYDSVETLLARLDKSETEYVKGYRQLVSMLEGKTPDRQG